MSIDPMPLTGVGKVFKPHLRWLAAERAFLQALDGIPCAVTVGAHGTHGSLATVTVSGVETSARAALTKDVQSRLAPFVIRHEIVWT